MFVFVDINVNSLALLLMKMNEQQEAVFRIALFFIISILIIVFCKFVEMYIVILEKKKKHIQICYDFEFQVRYLISKDKRRSYDQKIRGTRAT